MPVEELPCGTQQLSGRTLPHHARAALLPASVLHTHSTSPHSCLASHLETFVGGCSQLEGAPGVGWKKRSPHPVTGEACLGLRIFAVAGMEHTAHKAGLTDSAGACPGLTLVPHLVRLLEMADVAAGSTEMKEPKTYPGHPGKNWSLGPQDVEGRAGEALCSGPQMVHQTPQGLDPMASSAKDLRCSHELMSLSLFLSLSFPSVKRESHGLTHLLSQ